MKSKTKYQENVNMRHCKSRLHSAPASSSECFVFPFILWKLYG